MCVGVGVIVCGVVKKLPILFSHNHNTFLAKITEKSQRLVKFCFYCEKHQKLFIEDKNR